MAILAVGHITMRILLCAYYYACIIMRVSLCVYAYLSPSKRDGLPSDVAVHEVTSTGRSLECLLAKASVGRLQQVSLIQFQGSSFLLPLAVLLEQYVT